MRGWIGPAALGLAVLGGSGAASADGTEQAVRAFLRAYDTRSARVRRKAVGMLDAVPGPAATAALLPALGDEDPRVRERARDVLAGRVEEGDLRVLAERGLRAVSSEVRRRCADALGAARERAAPHAAALAAALRDREAAVRESAAAALGATGQRGQAPVVAAAIPREPEPEVRGALLLALAGLDGPRAEKEAARLAERDRDGPPCTAALRVLDARDPAGAAAAASGLLRHPAWEVRVRAAEVLARRAPGPGAVDDLLAALGREKRVRVVEALAGALERITGVPLGDDPARWRRWWGEHREGWTPAAPPASPPPPPSGRASGEGKSVARFYDIPVDGDQVAFVLDTSRSMNAPARLGETATKMELAIAQVAKTFAALDGGVVFNVVAFDTEVRRWRPRGVPSVPAAKHEALRFLQKQLLEGRTNIFDALATAMADREVDTVFLLTDGAPTAGEETGRLGFLRGLDHLRRWRPVRVHCVEVGAGNTGSRWRGFLEEIAAATGGIAVSK